MTVMTATADPQPTPADVNPERSPVLTYVVVTFAWTWSLWWTAVAAGRLLPDLPDPLPIMLFMTGGLGPLVGAGWVARHAGPAYRRTLLRRIWDPRGIPLPWWIALIAVAVGPAALGAALAAVLGSAASPPDHGLAAVAGVLAFALAAGVVEEPGWRGAASDHWQIRTPPAVAAVGIGVIWALWHLPLYFIQGSYQHGLGLGSVRFWLTNLALVQLGVLYLWLVNGSGGSILMAILAHAGFNAAGELVPRSTTGDVIAFVLLGVAALAVIVLTRGRLGFAGLETGRPPTSGPLVLTVATVRPRDVTT